MKYLKRFENVRNNFPAIFLRDIYSENSTGHLANYKVVLGNTKSYRRESLHIILKSKYQYIPTL